MHDRCQPQHAAEGGALVFRALGSVWRLGRWQLALPLHLLLGRASVEERPMAGDEGAFTMKMAIRHPLGCEVFRYSGRFRLDGRRLTCRPAA